MSDPYQTPAASAEPELPRTGMPIPDSVVGHLALVRPWARACSVAGFIAGLALLALTLLRVGFGAFASLPLPPPLAALIVVSLLFSGFTFAAAGRLWAFATSIDQLCRSMDGSDLEVTVHLLHRFWRLAGIAAFFLLLGLGILTLGLLPS